jgi:hypothetical protein
LEDLKGIPDDISIATEELESFRVSYLNSWTLQPDIRIDTASGSLYAPLGDGTWLLQGMAPWTDGYRDCRILTVHDRSHPGHAA